MNQHKRSDKRRRILSPQGGCRLQDAICKKFGEDFRYKPPFQELSNLTESSGTRRLDPDTVSRIWHRKEGVYRGSLERLFSAVELTLNQSDHIPCSSPSKLSSEQEVDNSRLLDLDLLEARIQNIVEARMQDIVIVIDGGEV